MYMNTNTMLCMGIASALRKNFDNNRDDDNNDVVVDNDNYEQDQQNRITSMPTTAHSIIDEIVEEEQEQEQEQREQQQNREQVEEYSQKQQQQQQHELRPLPRRKKMLMKARSTSSVSTLAYGTASDTSMVPFNGNSNVKSTNNILNSNSNFEQDNKKTTSPKQQQQQQQQQQQKRKFQQQLSLPANTQHPSVTATSQSSESSETRSLKHSSSISGSSGISRLTSSNRSISPAGKGINFASNTAKHEQTTVAAANSAAAANAIVPVAATNEKEKKRKEVSSSRVKKFHRHFSQISKDEKLINYYSCALVSDILLQGHLYITDQHFAFYSNVFGYVTKVVIPTSSVTKISKEKTAKIIPNAVGVATADERHVFGSFISREAAFRLMCSVCPPLAPIEILPKAPADSEVFEEYSIEDDSSCSISGNESPPQLLVSSGAVLAAVQNTAQSIPEENQLVNRRSQLATANSGIPAQDTTNENTNLTSNLHLSQRSSSTSPQLSHKSSTNPVLIIAGTGSSSNTSPSSSPTPSTSSVPTTVAATASKTKPQAVLQKLKTIANQTLVRLKYPTELHVVYVGVLLSMILALFSVFLLYRILNIEAKTDYYQGVSRAGSFNWRSGNDEDIFAEALRWQKDLQAKSTEEAQNILTANLEQIAKVRRSLETLSMLIHDRSSSSSYTNMNRDDSD